MFVVDIRLDHFHQPVHKTRKTISTQNELKSVLVKTHFGFPPQIIGLELVVPRLSMIIGRMWEEPEAADPILCLLMHVVVQQIVPKLFSTRGACKVLLKEAQA